MPGLIVVCFYFKEAALMMAYWADFGCFFADMYVSAIAADPYSVTVA